jgi:hypothetical protein
MRKPDGHWIAIENLPEHKSRLIGVFGSFDLAETACRECENYRIANIHVGKNYRAELVGWRIVGRAVTK